LWIGDASRIRAAEVRQQKTDRRDAALLLKLLLENRFPRIWTPSAEQRDQRQLLLHRHKRVEMRVRVKNERQHLAMNRGITRGRRLWNKTGEKVLRELSLQPWANRRREDLFKVRAMLDEQINSLDAAVAKAAEENELAGLLMTHPGVGPIRSLALVVTMGDDLGWKAENWFNHEAGEPFYENPAGGSGAVGGAVRAGVPARVFASLPWKRKGDSESGGGAEVGDSPLLDAAKQHRVSRDRSCREQLAGAPGPPAWVSRRPIRNLDWALSSR
jgi:transposase